MPQSSCVCYCNFNNLAIPKILLKKKISFLIVDDNSVMRRTIRRIVDEFASEIIECSDGAAAFSAYQTHLPDWVLMDVEMREKDGLTATREICREYPEARIVIVTKHSDSRIREAAQKAGAFGFVVKENLLILREIISAFERES